MLTVFDQAGVGTGVGDGVGSGVGDADGSGEGDGVGEGDGDGVGSGGGAAVGATDAAGRIGAPAGSFSPGPSVAERLAAGGVTTASAGVTARASMSTASRPAPTRRAGRRVGAARSSLAIGMLPSLGGAPCHQPWPERDRLSQRWYQHGTAGGTVLAMVQVWLAHGASGTPASMAPWVDGLVARGIDAAAVALPRGSAERAVRRFSDQVPDAPGMVVGGRSFGGRVASLLAAGGTGVPPRVHPVAAIVALSYPLHRPGRPDPGLARAAHWPALTAPVLLLSGSADPFADLALLRAAAAHLPRGELVLYKGLGHDLAAVREDVLDRIAAFVGSLDGPGGGHDAAQGERGAAADGA